MFCVLKSRNDNTVLPYAGFLFIIVICFQFIISLIVNIAFKAATMQSVLESPQFGYASDLIHNFQICSKDWQCS
jgi:hypothetical protein